MSSVNPGHEKSEPTYSFIVGGGVLMAAGLAGMDAVEAATPQEALMSVDLQTLNIEPQYIVAGDLGFIALGAIGFAAASAGVSNLVDRIKSRKSTTPPVQ